MTYCSQCQRRVVVLPHPGRNPGSKPKHVAFKDHDLCRQCFRTEMAKAQTARRHG